MLAYEVIIVFQSEEWRGKSMINADTHVYCTHCKWFQLDDEDIPYCAWEDKCDIRNCEDSISFLDRPCYEERG